MEFLERLVAPEYEERWLVRVPGVDELRVAWLIPSEDNEAWLAEVVSGTRRWLDFAHPRVSAVHAASQLGRDTGARAVFVVDDDRGPTLADAAAQIEQRAERERWVVAQVITIADGLAAMARHAPGFVHRRLEPHRLFVEPTGRARLRAPVETVSVGPKPNYMGAGRVVGVPYWMSPEQARGVPVTPATDVFSLASNLAFALTGEHPFDGESFMDVLMKILTVDPSVPTSTEGLDRVLARAFARQPEERYPDPAAFATELYACVPDAGDYDAVLSDRIAAWWPAAPQAHGDNRDLAGARCTRTWESLAPVTADVRHCDGCQQPVVRATSLGAVLPLIGNTCVWYRGG